MIIQEHPIHSYAFLYFPLLCYIFFLYLSLVFSDYQVAVRYKVDTYLNSPLDTYRANSAELLEAI